MSISSQILEALHANEFTGMSYKELQQELPKAHPKAISNSLSWLIRAGKIHKLKNSGQRTQYFYSRHKDEHMPDLNVKPINSGELINKLELKIHKQERAVSFAIEGWYIKIGFLE
jgi:Fe2+ or Zn2+ uptake regulation protein